MFEARLDEALTRRAMVLGKDDIPALKEACRTYEAACTGIYKVFLEKALIQEDQYDYEQKISDLKPPPSDPFPESDTFIQMNQRLSVLQAQLDFLNNFFFFSPETMNLKTIRSILGLTNYIHWKDLSPTSSHMMTRNLTLYVEKIKQTGDTMAISILANSIKVLQGQQKQIKILLKKISIYAKQNYKLQARVNVLSKMTLDPKRILSDHSGTMQAIKFEFPVKWQGAPFYRELIEEILEEDFGNMKESLRERILESLEVKQKTVEKKTRNLDKELKEELMGLVGELAKAYLPLETIITRMDGNSRLMDENPSSFSQKLSRWITRVMLKRIEVFYDIQEEQLGKGKNREHLNFTSYINWLRMKANFYKSLNVPTSQTYIRASESSTVALEEFLTKNQQELKRILNKVSTLETFFKEATEGEIKKRVKGYKLEIKQLKGVITKVIAGLKDYQARQEEMDQLKNLGIDPNAE
ncbi:MAG: hypothetical protein B6241_00465 [Spirochaetaceae bacterium 4572_59]|nr:MAG: hypothetical protein B6241_00465 [Spirochaetaceae bacterium 4572_59]